MCPSLFYRPYLRAPPPSRRRFSISRCPLERDSTKGSGFVLTNPRVRVRRLLLLDGPSVSGLRPRLFYVMIPARSTCVRAESPPSSPSPGYRTDVSARRPGEEEGQAGTCFNLLVVLSRSPPTWFDVNTSG